MSDTPGEVTDLDQDGSEDGTATTLPAPTQASEPSESDYDAIEAAVMETARGRWFLKEYAKRNRNTDTQRVLSAIERLEERLGEQPAASADETSMALLSHNVLDLAEAITRVKLEVQELGGQGEQPDHFGTATVELEAIVEQTEKATSEILEAAEKIQEVVWVLREEGASETQCDIIESKIIDVYTACSFQDLTGQRSNKVVQLVSYVERRVGAMMEVLGIKDDAGSQPAAGNAGLNSSGSTTDDDASGGPQLAAHQENDSRPDAHLLNGPAPEGDGIEQDDVDAMFGDSNTASFEAEPEIGDEAGGDLEAEMADFDAIQVDEETEDKDEGSAAVAGEPEAADESVDETEPEDFDQIESSADDDSDENDVEAPPEIASDPDGTVASASDKDDDETPDGAADDQNADQKALSEERASNAETDGKDTESSIITDDMVVELHDAEILNQAADETLIEAALDQSEAAPDIFDVDALEFAGSDMLEAGDSARDLEAIQEYASVRGSGTVLVDMPDDFDVDSAATDMFIETPSEEQNAEDSAEPADKAAAEDESPLGQDIFDAESIDVGDEDDEVSIEADVETEDNLAPELVAESEEELDSALVEAESLEAETLDAEDLGSEPGTDNDPVDEEPVPYTNEERIALFS
ncbi:MAG: hypothetical protein AAGH43_10175 [Pseudomonadota bacterium]